jgi:D-alanine-D-alanine ligase
VRIALLYNEPTLPSDHPDYAQEAGVLEAVEAFTRALAGPHQVLPLGAGAAADELLSRLRGAAADVVVNLCEGFAGASAGEAHVASLLELAGVSYTGSGPECLSLVRDKARTKWLLAGAGVATPEFAVVDRSAGLAGAEALLRLGPAIVKPAAEDASLGITPASVVADAEALARQVELVHARYGPALVERYIDGREFNVGIVALPEVQVLPLAEVEFTADLPQRIVSYDAKWATGSQHWQGTPVRCPAEVDPPLADSIRAAALDAYRVTGCRDYARVDLRVDAAGGVYVLEVNANPDSGPSAGLARALAAAGIDFDEFAERLVATSHKRGQVQFLDAARRESSPRAPSPPPAITVRLLAPADRQRLVEIVRACGNFREEEVATADEVLAEAARDGQAGHYRVWVAEAAGHPVGWSCHGQVPLTDATWDLYWIAVDPAAQGQGIGQALLAHVEAELRAGGARWLLAETSGLPNYDATRRFYERAGYAVVSRVADFYRAGDARVTYGKRLE